MTEARTPPIQAAEDRRASDDALIGAPLDTPIGTLTLVASAAGLVAVLWPEDRPTRVPLGPIATDARGNGHIRRARDQLAAYFGGRLRRFDVALDLRGTPFQLAVWAELSRIPFGETRSYGAVAAAIGRPAASRAVGAANGRNPVSIIVPCHRVVGTGGSLTGFAGGLDLKRRLLALEGVGSDTLFSETSCRGGEADPEPDKLGCSRKSAGQAALAT